MLKVLEFPFYRQNKASLVETLNLNVNFNYFLIHFMLLNLFFIETLFLNICYICFFFKIEFTFRF